MRKLKKNVATAMIAAMSISMLPGQFTGTIANAAQTKKIVTKRTEVKVNNNKSLKNALKKKNVDRIVLNTASAKNFKVPKGNYKDKTLIINSSEKSKVYIPKGAKFKKIIYLGAVKNASLIIDEAGNKIEIASKTTLSISGKAAYTELTYKTGGEKAKVTSKIELVASNKTKKTITLTIIDKKVTLKPGETYVNTGLDIEDDETAQGAANIDVNDDEIPQGSANTGTENTTEATTENTGTVLPPGTGGYSGSSGAEEEAANKAKAVEEAKVAAKDAAETLNVVKDYANKIAVIVSELNTNTANTQAEKALEAVKKAENAAKEAALAAEEAEKATDSAKAKEAAELVAKKAAEAKEAVKAAEKALEAVEEVKENILKKEAVKAVEVAANEAGEAATEVGGYIGKISDLADVTDEAVAAFAEAKAAADLAKQLATEVGQIAVEAANAPDSATAKEKAELAKEKSEAAKKAMIAVKEAADKVEREDKLKKEAIEEALNQAKKIADLITEASEYLNQTKEIAAKFESAKEILKSAEEKFDKLRKAYEEVNIEVVNAKEARSIVNAKMATVLASQKAESAAATTLEIEKKLSKAKEIEVAAIEEAEAAIDYAKGELEKAGEVLAKAAEYAGKANEAGEAANSAKEFATKANEAYEEAKSAYVAAETALKEAKVQEKVSKIKEKLNELKVAVNKLEDNTKLAKEAMDSSIKARIKEESGRKETVIQTLTGAVNEVKTAASVVKDFADKVRERAVRVEGLSAAVEKVEEAEKEVTVVISKLETALEEAKNGTAGEAEAVLKKINDEKTALGEALNEAVKKANTAAEAAVKEETRQILAVAGKAKELVADAEGEIIKAKEMAKVLPEMQLVLDAIAKVEKAAEKARELADKMSVLDTLTKAKEHLEGVKKYKNNAIEAKEEAAKIIRIIKKINDAVNVANQAGKEAKNIYDEAKSTNRLTQRLVDIYNNEVVAASGAFGTEYRRVASMKDLPEEFVADNIIKLADNVKAATTKLKSEYEKTKKGTNVDTLKSVIFKTDITNKSTGDKNFIYIESLWSKEWFNNIKSITVDGKQYTKKVLTSEDKTLGSERYAVAGEKLYINRAGKKPYTVVIESEGYKNYKIILQYSTSNVPILQKIEEVKNPATPSENGNSTIVEKDNRPVFDRVLNDDSYGVYRLYFNRERTDLNNVSSVKIYVLGTDNLENEIEPSAIKINSDHIEISPLNEKRVPKALGNFLVVGRNKVRIRFNGSSEPNDIVLIRKGKYRYTLELEK